MPERIQRKRSKGWRMPANTVSVCRPGQWGNPYRGYPAGEAVELFRLTVTCGAHRTKAAKKDAEARAEFIKAGLRGKNLACWCPLDQPCHADVLLEIANAKGDGE